MAQSREAAIQAQGRDHYFDVNLKIWCNADGTAIKRLYLPSVQNELTQDDISSAFSYFGEVEEVLLIKETEHSSGFVTFRQAESATKAWAAKFHTICGQATRISIGQSKRSAKQLKEAGQITHLKKEFENRANAHTNMEKMLTGKVISLENQLEKSTEKVVDLEMHLKFVRKREAALNSEMAKLRSQSLLEKQNYNDGISELQKANKSLESKHRKMEHEMNCALANLQRQYNDLERKVVKSDHINLKFLGEDNTVVQYKLPNRNVPLRRFMKAYCDRAGLSMQAVQFRFDGQPINENNAPDFLEMEEGDTIEVYTHPTNGRQ